jgi:hypothetical protein
MRGRKNFRFSTMDTGPIATMDVLSRWRAMKNIQAFQMPTGRFNSRAWLFIALGLLLGFYFVALPYFVLLVHNDLGWHIATGDLIRITRKIPLTDPWSYASANQPWINLAWAWDILLSALYEEGGMAYMHLLTFALGGLCLMLLFQLGIAFGATSSSGSLSALFALAIIPFYGMPDIFFSASPQLASYVLTLVLLLLCCREPSYWLAPVLMFAWVNLHNSFPLGLVILGLHAAVAAAKNNHSLFKRFFVVTLLSALATLLTPYGLDAHKIIIRTFGHISQAHISEWQPFHSLLNGPLRYSAWPVLLFFGAYLLALRRVWLQKINIPLAHLILSLMLLGLALMQYRYVSVWILVSAPLLGITNQCERLMPNWYRFSMGALALYLILLFSLMPESMRQRYPQGINPAAFRYPADALAFIASNYPKAKVANHWNYGSWIILYYRDQMYPMIDGRALTAYPDSLFTDFYETSNDVTSVAWEKLLKNNPPDVILWMAKDVKQNSNLRTLKSWNQVYADEHAIVLARSKKP